MRSPSPVRPALLVLAIFAAACGPEVAAPPADPTGDKPMASAAAPTTAEPAAAKAPAAAAPEETAPPVLEAKAPTVKLLEPGKEPRRALRYKFKAGASEWIDMDMKMTMAMGMATGTLPRHELPTVHSVLRVDAREVTPDGDVRLELVTTRMTVQNDRPIDAAMREAIEKPLAGLVGMRSKVKVSPRGVASELDFELPPGADGKARSQLESMRESLRNMYTPLPEEPVGPGARWEVTSRVPLSGAVMDVAMAYTLTKLEANAAHATVQTTLSAPPAQRMTVAALPPGATATLDSLSGTGSGDVAPSFVRLVPTATNKVNMDSAFLITTQKGKVKMVMQTEMALSIRPGKPAPAATK